MVALKSSIQKISNTKNIQSEKFQEIDFGVPQGIIFYLFMSFIFYIYIVYLWTDEEPEVKEPEKTFF